MFYIDNKKSMTEDDENGVFMPSLSESLSNSKADFNNFEGNKLSYELLTDLGRKMIEGFRINVSNFLNDRIDFFDRSKWAELAKNLHETEKDAKLVQLVMVELGYPPHQNIDIYIIREFARIYREDEESIKSNIDSIIVNYFDYEYIKYILDTWENKNFLKDRIHILREVVMCHNLCFYNTSIPTITAQFEGLLIDSFEIKGFVNGRTVSILLETLFSSNEDSFESNMDQAIDKYYRDNLLAGFEHGERLLSQISRNAILHGGDKNYGSVHNSIKLILLFDYIVYSISRMTEDIKKIGQKRVKEYREKKNSKNRGNRKKKTLKEI